MARRVEARSNYQADTRNLSTLIEAIMKDVTKDEAWKKEVTGYLKAAIIKLVQG